MAALKKDTSSESAFSFFFFLSKKARYKFWALAAILLLAFWSMFTGSVSLKWSAGTFARFYDGPLKPIFDDLDILEVEDRERDVRHMWNLYTHGGGGRLPRFWSEAFEAAYEDLIGDDLGLRDAALLEIARMSLQSIHVDVDPIPMKPKGESKLKSGSKQKQIG
ncbi:Aldehyde dehydrogenase [Cucumis melo var. makuwa]|uniref:Aldehyde dehydrogenase n=1 Tax=Cucumis melo var. makuwa TaxID=1194695 RepID=A0A5A7VD87_CUCMM|nr:Aldehyde dehydrogenase [Cucumis melo var. makuwa]